MNTDELQKAVELLSEVWENVREIIEELVEVLNEAFYNSGVSTKEIPPAKRRVRTYDICSQKCKKYDYKPVARKNLPYQRRNF